MKWENSSIFVTCLDGSLPMMGDVGHVAVYQDVLMGPERVTWNFDNPLVVRNQVQQHSRG